MSDSLVLLGVRILRSVKPSRKSASVLLFRTTGGPLPSAADRLPCDVHPVARRTDAMSRRATGCSGRYAFYSGGGMQMRRVVRKQMRCVSADRGLFACPHSKECGRVRPAVRTFFPVFRTLAERSNIGHRTIRPYPVLSPPLRQEAYGMKKRASVTGNPFLRYRKTYSERGVTLTYDLPSPFLQNSTVPSTRANNV